MKLSYLKQKIDKPAKLRLGTTSRRPNQSTNQSPFVSSYASFVFYEFAETMLPGAEHLGFATQGRHEVAPRLIHRSPITLPSATRRERDCAPGHNRRPRIINDPSIGDLQMSLRDCRHFDAMRSYYQCGHSTLRDHPKDLE